MYSVIPALPGYQYVTAGESDEEYGKLDSLIFIDIVGWEIIGKDVMPVTAQGVQTNELGPTVIRTPQGEFLECGGLGTVFGKSADTEKSVLGFLEHAHRKLLAKQDAVKLHEQREREQRESEYLARQFKPDPRRHLVLATDTTDPLS